MAFSDNLKNELEFHNMQVKELSAKTGISKNTIDNYLSGQKSIPNAENTVRIAAALGTTAERLVWGKEKNSKKEAEVSKKTIKERIRRNLCLLESDELLALDKIIATMTK